MRRLKILKTLVILLTLILAVTSVSCSQQTGSSQITEKPTLIIYLLPYYNMKDKLDPSRGGRHYETWGGNWDRYNFMYSMLDKYDMWINKADIQVTEFSNADDMKTRMTVEMLSGGGPDIILVDPRYFPSLNKMPDGVFCDLNEFIDQDEDFNMDDYYREVMDSGVIRGKRYLAPIGFTVPVLYTTEGILKEYKITLDSPALTWRELADSIMEFMKGNEDKKIYFFDWNFDFSLLLKTSGLSFVDYENKTARFDSKEFIELLQIYKDIYPSICPVDAKQSYNYDAFWLMYENSVITNTRMVGLEPVRLMECLFAYESLLNSRLAIYPFPSYSGERNVYSEAEALLGINDNCKNKDYAFEFIKMVLGMHGRQLADYFQDGLYINKKVYSEILNEIRGTQNDNPNGLAVTFGTKMIVCEKSPEMPDRMINRADNLLSEITACEIFDYDLYRLIEEELPLMLSGVRDAEYTAYIIQDKATIYLNE